MRKSTYVPRVNPLASDTGLERKGILRGPLSLYGDLNGSSRC
jgi:hypothetical protein